MPTPIEAEYAIRGAVKKYLRTSWLALARYDDAAVKAWAANAARYLTGAERQIATMTAARINSELGSRMSLDLTAVTGEALRGVDPVTVMERAGTTTWTALADGKVIDEAASQGLVRALSIGLTNLQLAKTHAARELYKRSEKVKWTERVLSGRENCALCIVSSTQRYHAHDLMPIHPGCDCGIRHHKSEDPGQVIDNARLESIHRQVSEFTDTSDRGGREPDYRDLIMVREHGEYGPTLTWRTQKFTGPSDVSA